jgi:hypothetical protein
MVREKKKKQDCDSIQRFFGTKLPPQINEWRNKNGIKTNKNELTRTRSFLVT